MLAARFPWTQVLLLVEAVPASLRDCESGLAPEQAGEARDEPRQLALTRVVEAYAAANPTPIAHQRYARHCSIGQSALDQMRHAQELLSHQIQPGDLEEVFGREFMANKRE